MMDWAGDIEAKNYGIKRRTDRRNLVDLLRIVGPLLMVAGVLLFYAWVRSQAVDIGYEEQSLQAAEKAALRTQANYILEEQTLKNPQRIDGIARIELGMVLARTNQLVAPQIPDDQAAAVAQANLEPGTYFPNSNVPSRYTSSQARLGK
jgi:cell division protein FtsL